MIIISAKRYSYFLLEDDDGTWYLTYFTGGAFEIDICVKLTNNEIEQLKINPDFVNELVENFKKDKSIYENRRVIPSKRPSGKSG
jgi:hypothetical protein